MQVNNEKSLSYLCLFSLITNALYTKSLMFVCCEHEAVLPWKIVGLIIHADVPLGIS